MPLRNASRFSRPIRGIAVGAALIVGVSGPVGSAGAGVPAAFHPGTVAVDHVVGVTPAAPAPRSTKRVLRDALGTRATLPVPSAFTTRPVAVRAESTSYCGTPTGFGGSFQSQLGPNWTDLTARSYACRSAPATGSWPANTKFTVSYRGVGENVCRSQVSGEASNLWYKTSRGWVWSGGAVNPVWNTTC